MDAIEWKSDIPESTPARHLFIEQEALDETYRYALRGSSGRWFIQRTHLQSGTAQRTRFYPNKRLAGQVFDELTS